MPTTDFWLFAGIAVLALGIGQCSRMTSEGDALERLASSCSATITVGGPVPEICNSFSKK
jgi:hypothetical protein